MRHILAAFFSFFFALFSSPNAGHVDSITLNKTDITLSPGQSETLVATLKPDGVRALVQWSSTDPKVASVDQNGKVTAVAPGTATINVRARTQRTACTVTVTGSANNAVVEEADPGIVPDNAIDLGVIITRKDGSRYKIYWGDMNLGANSPYEAGDYYAWGETETKVSYSWKNYKWNDGRGSLLKYSKQDGLAQLGAEDDVAAVKLGGRWRMPTLEEWKALQQQCNWEYRDGSTTGGVRGWVAIGRKSGNSIFLPAGGKYGDKLYSHNELGFYQSSSIWPDEVGKCSNFRFIDEKTFVAREDRGVGVPVRPVWDGGDTDERPVYVLEDASMNDDDLGIDIIEAVSTTTGVVVINPNSGEESEKEKEIKELGAVDLGVVITRQDGTRYKLLVADCNLGAAKPENYGYYYAWGETTPDKALGFSRSHYKFVDGNKYSWSKYCPLENKEFWNTDYGPEPDDKAILDLEDDAAHVTLGGSWRIPYMEEMMALYEQCNWTWATINGIPGYIVSSITIGNMNFVFLPAAGQRVNDHLDSCKEVGFYITANLSDGFTVPDNGMRRQRLPDAEIVRFDSDKVSFEAEERFWGYSIRPVLTVELDPVMDKSMFRPKAVDLGVIVDAPGREPYKLYWADCNLGAVKPEGYGDYFAWGDTEPNYLSSLPLIWKPAKGPGDDPGYTLKYYKHARKDGVYTKYDRELTLRLEDDAAHANLGGGWRMPGEREWKALKTQCVWDWMEKEGVPGYRVTGPNGNSIFLPAAGYFEGRRKKSMGQSARFMLPILSDKDGESGICWYFFMNSEKTAFYKEWRHYSYSIRPVTEVAP